MPGESATRGVADVQLQEFVVVRCIAQREAARLLAHDGRRAGDIVWYVELAAPSLHLLLDGVPASVELVRV